MSYRNLINGKLLANRVDFTTPKSSTSDWCANCAGHKIEHPRLRVCDTFIARKAVA